jgi:hypothetical protein
MIPQYMEGVRLTIEEKFNLAEANYRQALETLHEKEEFKPRLISHVLQKYS